MKKIFRNILSLVILSMMLGITDASTINDNDVFQDMGPEVIPLTTFQMPEKLEDNTTLDESNESWNNFEVPGRLESNGTHFELNNSMYLNITIDSSEPIDLTLESIPEVITMYIEPVTGTVSTRIIIGGLVPLALYHKYEDDYHNHTTFTTDINGNFSYVQDISRQHLVFIQPMPSTKFINDSATGGDCTSFGIWNIDHKTCVLTSDVAETIQIDSDDITLDGNKYVKGIFLPERKNVTIRNLKVMATYNKGIYLYNSNYNNLSYNYLSNNYYGIYLYNSNYNNLSYNSLSSNDYGIYLDSSNNNRLVYNNANSNGYYGIYLYKSSDNDIYRNTANRNTRNGIYFGYSNNNTISRNVASENNFYRHPSNQGDGIIVSYSNDNNITDNVVNSNFHLGIYMIFSTNNTFSNNTIGANTYSFSVYGYSDSDYDHHVDISNLVNGKPIYYVTNAIDNIYDESTNAGTFYCISCYNVTIKGLTLKENTQGIFLWKTHNSKIERNTISNNARGIHLMYSDNNNLTTNIVNRNYGFGIYLEYSDYNTLANNTANSMMSPYSNFLGSGIVLTTSSNNLLLNNMVSYNRWGINIGSYGGYNDNNTIINNIVTFNDYGIYLSTSNNNSIINNTILNDKSLYNQFYPYGICLYSSGGNDIIGNNVSGNRHGIENMYSYTGGNDDNNISYNIMSNNEGGINIYGSKNSTLIGNILSNNIGGIAISGSNVTLVDNVALNNSYGLTIYSSNSNITGNNASNGNVNGIRLHGNNNNFSYNNASNNSLFGIMFTGSDNTLRKNVMTDNKYNFYTEGSSDTEFGNDIDKSNTVDGKPIYYEKNIVDKVYNSSTNAGTFYCINCYNVSIKELVTTKNGAGIYLRKTKNSTIEHNVVSNNLNGINIPSSNSNNTIKNNIVSNNDYGIYSWYSFNSSIKENDISNNSYGIYFGGINTKTFIYHNNLVNNTEQAVHHQNPSSPDPMNAWDDGYPSGGNYWRDYSGIDNYNGPNQDQPGSDDIGDTSYQILNNPGYNVYSKDRYPLMKPWKAVDITNPLLIEKIYFTPQKVEKGNLYTLNIVVKNQDPMDRNVKIEVSESNPIKIKPGTMDPIGGPDSSLISSFGIVSNYPKVQSLQQTIKADSSTTFKFTFQHEWDWLKILSTVIQNDLGLDGKKTWGLLTGAKILCTIPLCGIAYQINDMLYAQKYSLERIRYDYTITADTAIYPENNDAKMVIKVPTYKYQFLEIAWKTSGIFSVVGTIAEKLHPLSEEWQTVRYWNTRPLMISSGSAAAKSDMEIAIDPDFNYTEIAIPEPVYIAEIDAYEQPAKDFILRSVNILWNTRALKTSLGRYEGAKMDNNPEWMIKQLDASLTYDEKVLEDFYYQSKYIIRLISTLQKLNLSPSVQEIEDARHMIIAREYSSDELSALAKLGISDQEIIDMKYDITNVSISDIQNYNTTIKSALISIISHNTNATISLLEQKINIGVGQLGYNVSNGTSTEITELEILKSQIQTGLDTGYVTKELEEKVLSMINKSVALVERTNNLDYVHYFEYSTYAMISLLNFPIDVTPPDTTISPSGTLGNNNWYTSDVQITLIATDDEHGSGVAKTEYNTSVWTEYTNPFNIYNETSTTIYYRSIDNEGNIEPAKTQIVNVDKSSPIIRVDIPHSYGLYTIGTALNFSAIDIVSGIETLYGIMTNTSGLSQIVDNNLIPQPGVYNLIVNATDKAGNIATSDPIFFVVYDPEGGFATGGGWFNPDSNSTLPGGRANFGFVAKYKNGNSTGNLEFQYKDADINLKSTTIDWLVISGVGAQFQGTGTINGQGLYTFRVMAKDNGEPGAGTDHFDIRIWNGTNTETDPYHKAKNTLAGGNIVVHKK